MKRILIPLLLSLAAHAAEPDLADQYALHQSGARDLSNEQDELAADVQQLTIEQTHPNVIELFRRVEEAMDEASEFLYEHETGGVTIAAETDVIERIYEAAKERQRQQGTGSEGGSAMLDMMERMMGREPMEGSKPGEQAGEQAGEGMTGDSDAANESRSGEAGGSVEERRVPKGAGAAGRSLPREFLDALKAYNRGTENLSR